MWLDIIFKSKKVADEYLPKIFAWRKKFLGSKTIQTVNKLTMLDYDALYEQNRQCGAELVPCGLDNESIALGGDPEDIKRALFMSSDGNLNFIASCKCGHLKGNFLIGQICPMCNSEVCTEFADEIKIQKWLEIPETLPPFLHPDAYRVLDKWIGAAKRKTSILDSILNCDADLPEPYNRAIGQGMWYFYENFKSIVNYIASLKKNNKSKETEEVFEFLRTYGQPTDEKHPYGRLFTRHIPILNQSLHILTHSGSLTYNDVSSDYIFKTVLELHHVIQTQRHQPIINKNLLDQHVFTTYKSWIEYTDSIIQTKIQGKTGFIRKCILGVRAHASGRAVIVPITHTHWADEVELPWRMVTGLYKLEIFNRLRLKYGFDTNTALEYISQAQIGPVKNEPEHVVREVNMKIRTVKSCLDELLAECPYKGLPIILGRNPRVERLRAAA